MQSNWRARLCFSGSLLDTACDVSITKCNHLCCLSIKGWYVGGNQPANVCYVGPYFTWAINLLLHLVITGR
jgi:hypothetical protein